MSNLNPEPATLGLTSPALGLWFEERAEEHDLAPLAPPNGDLSITKNLPNSAIWNAPATGILSYFIATAKRPTALSDLRQADGELAFNNGALVLLFTLLPEVSSRLASLTQALPRPDSTVTASENEITRPEINRFAMEIPISIIENMADLTAILPNDLKLKGDNVSDEEKAAFLGLKFDGNFKNAETPATILRRPEKASAKLIENNLSPINAKLWAFDRNGRPYDPGSIATMWNHLATEEWENLWASSNANRQRTTAVEDAKIVHLVNAHEGPLEEPIKERIADGLNDLTAIDDSEVLFNAGLNPTITLSIHEDIETDTAPLARIAPLPAGPYRRLSEATPFAGWQENRALNRDFLRIAITDIEKLTIGLSREEGTTQADSRLRISPKRNIANPLFLPTIDEVASKVMERFNEPDASVSFIAPELDKLWGAQSSPDIGNANPFDEEFNNLVFEAYTLKGSGSTSGETAENQTVVLHFKNSLPSAAWIRVWSHGRDTKTGRRFKMDGGAALSQDTDTLVLLPLPNGNNGNGTNRVQFSFDMLVSTTTGHHLYTDLQANRPAVDIGSGAISITALSDTQQLFSPERSSNFTAASNEIEPGLSLMVIEGSIEEHNFIMFDKESLRAEDLSNTLINSSNEDDTIVTFDPAFKQTQAGNLGTTQHPSGPKRIHEGVFYNRLIGQEIIDFAAYDSTQNRGVIAGVSARTPWHEAPPISLGHIGRNASPEIHGEGIAIEGPVADDLRLLMRERTADGIVGFVQQMGVPFREEEPVDDLGVWTAILETSAKGTHGGKLMSLIPNSVNPGLEWNQIKEKIDTVLSSLDGGLTVDSIIDNNSFDNNLASASFDRVLTKNRNGVQGFARAAISAIKRAEDLIWLQSPTLDDEKWEDSEYGDIYLLESICTRLNENPALHCIFIIPEKQHPGQNIKLAKVRQSAIANAMYKLLNTAEDRVVFATPTAFYGRPSHMTSTSLIVDDVVMFSGAAHTWRRGLTFDSALTAAIFDEHLIEGRPSSILEVRLNMAGDMLGVGNRFIPKTAKELVAAIKAQNRGGGFGRINPLAFVASDKKNRTENAIWNPAISNSTEWTAFLATLIGDIKTEFENGVR